MEGTVARVEVLEPEARIVALRRGRPDGHYGEAEATEDVARLRAFARELGSPLRVLEDVSGTVVVDRQASLAWSRAFKDGLVSHCAVIGDRPDMRLLGFLEAMVYRGPQTRAFETRWSALAWLRSRTDEPSPSRTRRAGSLPA